MPQYLHVVKLTKKTPTILTKYDRDSKCHRNTYTVSLLNVVLCL